LEELISKITQLEVTDNPFDNIFDYVKLAADNDPDVLIVDTKIDYPTFKLLLNTALGGKLVILTDTYSTIVEALEGLLEKDEGFVIAAAVNGIIAQRVIRRICPDCKGKLSWDKKKTGVSSPKGSASCSKCNSTGYSGKIGVFEVFYMDSEFKNLITKDEKIDMVKNKLKNDKSTFEENCVRLIVEEVTSIDEVIRLGFGNKLYDF
jgi:type II secretory ATPase GspE/PulE/Tfp pilus assembly ATPase PilB-like protein